MRRRERTPEEAYRYLLRLHTLVQTFAIVNVVLAGIFWWVSGKAVYLGGALLLGFLIVRLRRHFSRFQRWWHDHEG